MAVAHQAPLSMRFSRQEYQSGLPFPSPGDLPHPGIELVSPALAGGFFTTGANWEALSGSRGQFRKDIMTISLPTHPVPQLDGKSVVHQRA